MDLSIENAVSERGEVAQRMVCQDEASLDLITKGGAFSRFNQTHASILMAAMPVEDIK
jgi:hypothetical protein